MATRYLDALDLLERAEADALAAGDYDTLGRLYMPLQEARRQKRQVAGEGEVNLTLLATGPDDAPDAATLLDQHPHGQFLVAGWGDLSASVAFNRLARERQRYAETYLAAAYPVGDQRAVAIVPTADVALPPADGSLSPSTLQNKLPPHSLLIPVAELPEPQAAGDAGSFALTMGIWEKLHAPFLATAQSIGEPLRRIEAYRQVIRVDEACELAHQWLSETALDVARAEQKTGLQEQPLR